MNEIYLNLLIFVIGAIILFLGSDWLVHSSVKFAYLLRVAPLIIGIVFISFGTSLPEAAVGITAALENRKFIAFGNIVGSNIANIGLILGITGLIRPVKVDSQIFKREIPFMIFSSVLLYVFCLDLQISRIEGLFFLFCFAIFCTFIYKDPYISSETEEEFEKFKFNKLIERLNSKTIIFLILILSLVFVIFGANLMINSGINIARFFKISPWIIGLTLLAVGTSVPELAVSFTASLKKVSSISIGNIVGSNIFNILFVLGIVSLIVPISVEPSVLKFELPVMILFTLAVVLFMKTRYLIRRLESGLLFLGYLIFLALLFR